LARGLGRERIDAKAPGSLPAAEPARDALEARPPERPGLGKIFGRAEVLTADLEQFMHRLIRQRGRERFGELAEGAMDDAAAIGSARLEVDGVELLQSQNVPGIDGVGVAQPVLDVGDREGERARVARRPWHRLGDRREAVGSVKRARKADVAVAAFAYGG